MNKLSKIINDLDYEELKLIKKDLELGNIEKLVTIKIKEHEGVKSIICPVCHTIIQNPDDGAFTLFFGPAGFRKKASFCATDCLEYFINHIKNLSYNSIKKGEEDSTFRNNTNI